MKTITKTQLKKVEGLLENRLWELYTRENDYKGGKVEQLSATEIRQTLENLEGGQAHYEKTSEGEHVIHYAGKCKWVAQ